MCKKCMKMLLITYSDAVIPVILEKPLSTAAVEGDSIQLTCVFKDQPSIAWFRNGYEVTVDDSYRVCIEEDTSLEHKVRSTLSIWNVVELDKGYYTCVATESVCDPVTSAPAIISELSINIMNSLSYLLYTTWKSNAI